MSGFAYLAVRPDGVYKIGSSTKPEKRLAALVVKSPGITLVHKIASANHKLLEDWLHFAFSHRRIKYEWFRLDASDVNKITAVARADSADDMPDDLQEMFAANTFGLLKANAADDTADLPAARNPTRGTTRIEIELEEGLAARMDELRAKFGHSMREEIELAILRHFDTPLPAPLPPPTEAQMAAVKRGRGRPKKSV